MPVYLRLIPMLACMGIIFFLSHMPGDDSAVFLFPGSDKLAHMVVYGLLSWTVILSFSPGTRKQKRWLVFMLALTIPVLYGVSDEYHQSYVLGRSSELFDVVADALGALLASLFWVFKTSKHQ